VFNEEGLYTCIGDEKKRKRKRKSESRVEKCVDVKRVRSRLKRSKTFV
jgi:hypothetical protein